MNTRVRLRHGLVLVAMLVLGTAMLPATADDFSAQLTSIQHAWDQANYGTADAQAKKSSLEQLARRTQDFVKQNPGRAEALIWQGIVLSSYAGAKGGLGALSLAKQARDSLLAALNIDPNALRGSAYTSLGALYYKVPRFPLGFGSHDKAAEYLQHALAVNPEGIDPNYFYGEFLFEEGEYKQSLHYLQVAQSAPPRPDRPLADTGRRREIDALMARVRAKLS